MKKLLLFVCLLSGCSFDFSYLATFERRENNKIYSCYKGKYSFKTEVTIMKKYIHIDDKILTVVRYDIRPDNSVDIIAELQEEKYCVVMFIEQTDKTINGIYTIGMGGVLHPFLADCFDNYIFNGER